MRQLFSSGGQSVGASALGSVFPMDIQGWFPLGLAGLISLQSKGLLQHHSLKASVLWHLAFLIVLLSHLYVTAGETTVWTIQTFVSKVVSLLFNTLSWFVIAFLPRSKCLFNFMSAVTVCSDFGAQENKICHRLHFFTFYLPWSDGNGFYDLRFLNVEF